MKRRTYTFRFPGAMKVSCYRYANVVWIVRVELLDDFRLSSTSICFDMKIYYPNINFEFKGARFNWKSTFRVQVIVMLEVVLQDVDAICSGLPALTTLNLTNNLTSNDVVAISHLKNLRYGHVCAVILMKYRVYIMHIEVLKDSLCAIEELHLMGNKMKDITVGHAVNLELDFTFGMHLEEIHVTWTHLEKKRTRLRTYTNISQDNVLSSWRRRHRFNVTPSQRRPRRRHKISRRRQSTRPNPLSRIFSFMTAS
ncbi:hypothetical protein Tco_1276047 [Tanacetum coccineum]